ncbi:MAG: phosphodiester glycosidase family protein, partial [Planctomycetaceae bacterium]|nr:phosphodiester glycosidase family protein [Planctomycetaceae bacterium]
MSFVLCVGVAFSEDSPVIPVPDKAEWASLFEGIKSSQASADSPRLQRVFAIQIDTAAKGISFFTTPKAEDGYEPGKKETVRQRTNDFLEQYKLQVAINADFFAIPKGEKYATPGIADLQGLTISEGNVVSLPDKKFAAVFRVSKDGKVHIENVSDENKDFSDTVTAVAGTSIILRGGKAVPLSGTDIHPRTLVGISQDERYVILLVIDGRRKGHSNGATLNESAQWLQYFGAWAGLNL